MDERTKKQIRKYKCDKNMKQADHGVRVSDFRLKQEVIYGCDYANAYITVSVPFYDASLRDLVAWARDSFPELGEISDCGIIETSGFRLDLYQIGHGKPNKSGDAPIFVTFRIMERSNFRKFMDFSLTGIQARIDAAYVGREAVQKEENGIDAPVEDLAF